MATFWKKVVVRGSVLSALLALGGAAYSIAINTPTKAAPNEPRVLPPTQPTLKDRGDGLAHVEYIGAAGIVEPQSEAIAIGTNVPGVVTKVLVRPGDKVKAGDVLFVIDDRSPRADLAARQAEHKAAEMKLRELEAQIDPAKAKVLAAEAGLKQAKVEQADVQDQLRRAQSLSTSSAVSIDELNRRKFASEMSTAKILEMEAKLTDMKATLKLLADPNGAPTLDVQRANIEMAQTAVKKAQVLVDLHTVRAPIDCTVLQVKVRVGEFASAAFLSEPLMILGVIDPLHIRVDVDESEINRVKSGTVAYASMRGQAEKKARLQYVRTEPYVIPKKSLTGGVSERVDTRVMQLIYSVSPQDFPALIGQQVDVFIETKPTASEPKSTGNSR